MPKRPAKATQPVSSTCVPSPDMSMKPGSPVKSIASSISCFWQRWESFIPVKEQTTKSGCTISAPPKFKLCFQI